MTRPQRPLRIALADATDAHDLFVSVGTELLVHLRTAAAKERITRVSETDVYGPARFAALSDGTVRWVRTHTTSLFDQGAA